MRTNQKALGHNRRTRWPFLLAVLLLSAAEALAQEQTPAAKNEAAKPAQPERRIVISIPDRQLALVENGEVVKVYPIAVGAAETPSPTGEFKIINRLTKPTYYTPGKVIKPGAENPLGTRWMGLSLRGFGIHGTNDPKSIGLSASHGCIRMHKKDVEELFELVRVGDVVSLHGERTEEIAALFPSRQTPAAPLAPAQAVPGPVVAAVVPG